MIIPSIVNSLRYIIQNCWNTEFDFPLAKNNQVLTADHYFSVENGNSKQEEIGSIK